MSNRFFPGQVDYDGIMVRDFNAGRAVSLHAQEVWRSVLEPYLGAVSRVLDVGSGTGASLSYLLNGSAQRSPVSSRRAECAK